MVVGKTTGTRTASIKRIICFEIIFPKSLTERVTGLARWAIISIMKMSNIRGIAGMDLIGPKKCPKYFKPWILIPRKCVDRKTQTAIAALVFMLLVGDSKPGIRPIRLHVRI